MSSKVLSRQADRVRQGARVSASRSTKLAQYSSTRPPPTGGFVQMTGSHSLPHICFRGPKTPHSIAAEIPPTSGALTELSCVLKELEARSGRNTKDGMQKPD
ncbi:unnamed protein product [Cercospora beticola]|nr:unnamed protein product [Cercospora beticola]